MAGDVRAVCQAAGDNPSLSHRVGKGEARDTVGPLLRGSQPWEHSALCAQQMVTGPALVCERNCILWGSGAVAVRAATCVAQPGRGSCSCPVTVVGLIRASSSVIGPFPFDGCWSPWVFSVLCVCVYERDHLISVASRNSIKCLSRK